MQRLKTRSQFQAVLAGSVVARTTHFVLHRSRLDIVDSTVPGSGAKARELFSVHAAWLGAMVPKRWAKRAVTRNTIKRQIYSVSTEMQSLFPAAAHVVRLRAPFDRAVFVSATSDVLKAAVRQELQQLFAVLRVAAQGATRTAA